MVERARARARAMADGAVALATGAGVALPDDLVLWDLAGGRPTAARAEASADPGGELGRRLEALLSTEERKQGAHYTPPVLADRLAALAVPATNLGRPVTACDPACGGGAVLLALARRLASSGIPPATVARDLLWGADLDPLAAAVTEAAVALWSGGVAPAPGHVVAGDPLHDLDRTWGSVPPGGFGAVAGNPPFQAQLSRATARTRQAAAELRERFGGAAAGYVDTAALFLLVAVDLAGPGARVVLVQPASVAASRDAAGVRAALGARAGPLEVWVPTGRPFGAAVQVCVPVLEVGRPGPSEWAPLLAAAAGVPPVDLAAGPTLGGSADVVAGFRDEYYGLVPHVREAPPAGAGGPGSRARFAPLVTSGAIDLGGHGWGSRAVRFAKRSWQRPVVDLATLAQDGGRAWTHARRVRRPKVVVASQTRVVEPAPDHDGTTVPVTPVISVLPHGGADAVGRVAVLLASPAVSAWAAGRLAGSGLGRGTLRLTGPALASVPLPVDADAWDAAAVAFGAWCAAGRSPTEAETWARPALAAHGIGGEGGERLLAWWTPLAMGGR